MSLTQAIKEAYADPDVDDDVVHTLQLDHPTFDAPVRIVANADGDMTLPLENGVAALFTACGVSVTLTGFDDDGPTQGEIRIDNVSKILMPYLREAVQAGHPLAIVYRGYTMGDLSQPGEVRGGLVLATVSLFATYASGTLMPATKADRKAFPGMIYSLQKYPALNGLG